MLNCSIIIGRLVRDAKVFGDEKKVAKMTVAVDDGFGDKKRTDYIDCTAFGKTAEFCEKYLGKGVLVAVKGKIRTGSFEKKDGTKGKTLEIAIDDIKRLEWNDYNGARKTSQQSGEPVPDGFAELDESIPF